jgi:hypothetical protein
MLVSLAAAGAMAAGNTDSQGVTTSTDPAKAAAVERHAEELKAQQGRSQDMAANTSGTSTKHSKHKAHKHHRRGGSKSASNAGKQTS